METLLHIQKAKLFIERALRYVISYKKRDAQLPQAAFIPAKVKKWSSKIVNIVELIYAFDTGNCVDDGDGTLEELSAYVSDFFGVEIKDFSNSYVYMKKRKGDSRTYFLDELSRRLNERMDREDEKVQ